MHRLDSKCSQKKGYTCEPELLISGRKVIHSEEGGEEKHIILKTDTFHAQNLKMHQ